MKKILSTLLGILVLSIPVTLYFAKGDAANCKDHPLLTRIPDYWIESCVQKQFDGYKFNVGKGKV